ncbi:MAG: VPLPA-CTERM-specific exosortase XrtD [Pseudomonadota bacterium]
MAVVDEMTSLFARRDSRRIIAFALLPLIALVFLFWDALGNLWFRWGAQEELSHSYFIPLLSAWLAWSNRDVLRKSAGGPSLTGLAIIGVGGLLLLLGQVTHIFVIQHFGLVLAIAGLVAALGGVSLMIASAAPLAFLLFAVPPPRWVIIVLSWNFQFMSSELGVRMIELAGVPAYLSGNVIDIGDYKLEVAEACSGLRYLFPFLSLGVITAFLYRGPYWARVAIIVATVPITIFMNSVRVAATGVLVDAYGPAHAEGALHFFEGWVVFLLCLVALFGFVLGLNAIRGVKPKTLAGLDAGSLKSTAPSIGSLTLPKATALAAVIFMLTAGLSSFIKTDSLIIPERKLFVEAPYELTGWRFTTRALSTPVALSVGADDTLVADFVTPEEKQINLYLAYLEAQRDGRSWHSPRECIPGGGWKITDHDVLNKNTAGGETLTYNRLIIEYRGDRRLVYYWYQQRGRRIANEFVMKFWLIYDAVFKRRTDGALVRLMTPLTAENGAEDADALLLDMVGRVETFLPAYVPN